MAHHHNHPHAEGHHHHTTTNHQGRILGNRYISKFGICGS